MNLDEIDPRMLAPIQKKLAIRLIAEIELYGDSMHPSIQDMLVKRIATDAFKDKLSSESQLVDFLEER